MLSKFFFYYWHLYRLKQCMLPTHILNYNFSIIRLNNCLCVLIKLFGMHDCFKEKLYFLFALRHSLLSAHILRVTNDNSAQETGIAYLTSQVLVRFPFINRTTHLHWIWFLAPHDVISVFRFWGYSRLRRRSGYHVIGKEAFFQN